MVVDVLGPQLTLAIVLAGAFVLLITERLRNDVVGVLVPVALWGTGLLDAGEALSGFSSEPAIVVAAIFVLTAALQETGASEVASRHISRWAGEAPTRMIAVLMPAVALLSAFTHHVATTGALLPVAVDLAERRRIAASRLLMPVSFAASLGTTITIIGAPAFLIASKTLREAGEPGLGLFSIAPVGLTLTALGTLFMVGPGRLLLPERQGGRGAGDRFRLASYFTEVKVLAGSPLLEKSARELATDERAPMTVAGRLRGGQRLPAQFEAGELREGDVLLVRTSADQLLAVPEEPGVELHPVEQYQGAGGVAGAGSGGGHDEDTEPAERLVQAVVAPGSELVGATIGSVDFRARFGVIVLGLWRRDGWLAEEMARIPLRAGDVLVLQGEADELERLRRERSFLMLVPFQGERRVRRKAPLAVAAVVAAVAAAALGWPLQMAMLSGAVVAVLTRCLTPRQAYQAIDQRVFVFIAGAIPLGLAMERSGTSGLVARQLEGWVAGLPAMATLLVLFVVVGALTQFLSDSATTAVFAPVGVALAHGLEHAPTAYVVTIAMAAVTSFITPLGHHGNLLIYGTGGYRFSDFVRVGAPLTLVVAVAVSLLAPVIWPL